MLVAFVAGSFVAAMVTMMAGRLLLPERVGPAPDGLGAIQVGALAFEAAFRKWKVWGTRPERALAGVAAVLFGASVWRDAALPWGWVSILGQAGCCVVGAFAVGRLCRRAWGG